MPRDVSFPPVWSPATRLLILGSLPGQASLQAGQYYAHPQNQFWRLLGAVLGLNLMALSYPDRLASLQAARVGLWDVVASAQRRGSLDADLRNVSYHPLSEYLAGLPQLRAIAFNGQAAGRIRPRLAGQACALLQLPSSSPAFTLAYANKLALWQELGRYLKDE